MIFKATRQAVKEELGRRRAVGAHLPPALRAAQIRQAQSRPSRSDKDKCRGCKACLKIGCPAISMKDGKAVIDETLCVGCNLCKGLCAFGAIDPDNE